MKVGLVSDTHDNIEASRVVADLFRAERVEAAFHLGDVTAGETVRAFEGLPMRFLKGNNDFDRGLVPALEACGFPRMANVWVGEMAGVRVGAAHGHRAGDLKRLRATCEVVLHGHTHRRRAETEGGALMVNPGALFRARTRTCALLELPSREVRFYAVGPEGASPL